MKLSILIPVYNEKNTVLELLKHVAAVNLDGIDKEIIIVDDGSTDGTHQILKGLKNRYKVIFHKRNMGKGSAIRTALKYATGDILIIQDADLEYDPLTNYKLLIEPIKRGEADVVYGSRFLGKDKIDCKEFYLHYFGNRLLTFITNFLYNSNLTDMETCYKVFTKKVLDGIILKAKGFDLEPEITSKLLRKEFKIKEVPISYNSRDFNEGKKITKIDGLKALYYLFKYRFFD